VEEIDDGEASAGLRCRLPGVTNFPGTIRPGWPDDDAFDVFVHRLAMHEDRIRLAGASGEGEYNEENWQQLFHSMILGTNIGGYLFLGAVLVNGKFVLVPGDSDKQRVRNQIYESKIEILWD